VNPTRGWRASPLYQLSMPIIDQSGINKARGDVSAPLHNFNTSVCILVHYDIYAVGRRKTSHHPRHPIKERRVKTASFVFLLQVELLLKSGLYFVMSEELPMVRILHWRCLHSVSHLFVSRRVKIARRSRSCFCVSILDELWLSMPKGSDPSAGILHGGTTASRCAMDTSSVHTQQSSMQSNGGPEAAS
jgi:hypothetical protein